MYINTVSGILSLLLAASATSALAEDSKHTTVAVEDTNVGLVVYSEHEKCTNDGYKITIKTAAPADFPRDFVGKITPSKASRDAAANRLKNHYMRTLNTALEEPLTRFLATTSRNEVVTMKYDHNFPDPIREAFGRAKAGNPVYSKEYRNYVAAARTAMDNYLKMGDPELRPLQHIMELDIARDQGCSLK